MNILHMKYAVEVARLGSLNKAAETLMIAQPNISRSINGDISGAELYLDIFCKKSDTAKQYVQKWMPIVAASQSVKGNEKEREFLMSWVGVVDYQ